MFHTKLDLVNGLWQCHTILHIDITRNHSKKDLITFYLSLSTKLNLTYGALQSKITIEKYITFTFPLLNFTLFTHLKQVISKEKKTYQNQTNT